MWAVSQEAASRRLVSLLPYLHCSSDRVELYTARCAAFRGVVGAICVVAPGEGMGRAELAEAVNRHLWEATRKRYELDAHSVARYERGYVRWPGAHYRSGLRGVLGVTTDAELGFYPSRRGDTRTPPPATSSAQANAD